MFKYFLFYDDLWRFPQGIFCKNTFFRDYFQCTGYKKCLKAGKTILLNL
jgi:hypothetical protein